MSSQPSEVRVIVVAGMPPRAGWRCRGRLRGTAVEVVHDRALLAAHPGAAVALSYQMPAYKVGSCRLYIGVWKHGVSIYGWKQGRAAGFTTRHPELRTSTGTIRLRPEDAAGISDEEFRDLVRSALTPG